VGSNDYLLPHYSAGRHLRRLYNSFRESLLSAKATAESDDLITSLLQSGKRDSAGKFDMGATLNALSDSSRHLFGLSGGVASQESARRNECRDVSRGFLGLPAARDSGAVRGLVPRSPAGRRLDAVHYAVGKKAWFGTLTTNELATRRPRVSRLIS